MLLVLQPKSLVRSPQGPAVCKTLQVLPINGNKPSASQKLMTFLEKCTGVCTHGLPRTAPGPKSVRLSHWARANDEVAVRTGPWPSI